VTTLFPTLFLIWKNPGVLGKNEKLGRTSHCTHGKMFFRQTVTFSTFPSPSPHHPSILSYFAVNMTALTLSPAPLLVLL